MVPHTKPEQLVSLDTFTLFYDTKMLTRDIKEVFKFNLFNKHDRNTSLVLVQKGLLVQYIVQQKCIKQTLPTCSSQASQITVLIIQKLTIKKLVLVFKKNQKSTKYYLKHESYSVESPSLKLTYLYTDSIKA